MVDNPIYSRRDSIDHCMVHNGELLTNGRNNMAQWITSADGRHNMAQNMAQWVSSTDGRHNMGQWVSSADGRHNMAEWVSSAEYSRYEPNFMLAAPTMPEPADSTDSNLIIYQTPSPESHGYYFRSSSSELSGFEAKYQMGGLGSPLGSKLDKGRLSSSLGSKCDTESIPSDDYWHIPRASLWCSHKECAYNSKPCHWKGEENSSVCTSVTPPPTFTALDNYRPVLAPRRHCSCGVIAAITTIFSLIILLLITAFIIYIEMVLKEQRAYVPDRM